MTVCFWGEVKVMPLEIILSPFLLPYWRDFLLRQNEEGPKMALALVNYMGGRTTAGEDLLGFALTGWGVVAKKRKDFSGSVTRCVRAGLS